MHIPDIIIAIDGYSSTGKSSFAKIIANEFGFLYLDSGALYRGVTLFAIEGGYIDGETIDVPALDKALDTLDCQIGFAFIRSQAVNEEGHFTNNDHRKDRVERSADLMLHAQSAGNQQSQG